MGTRQAKEYNGYMFSYQKNGYRPETLVDKDGGTVKYYNPNTKETTYSISQAKNWYHRFETVYVSRDCSQTVIAILNPTKSITRKLKGNGNIRYYRVKDGDKW